jgi:TPR repeat protein
MILRSILILIVLGTLCACGKKPDDRPRASTSGREAVTNGTNGAALSSELLSNLVPISTSRSESTNDIVGRVASDRELPANVTNVVAAPPKPPAPAQDIYDHGVAVLRTNLTAAATEEALILFRAAAEKGNPSAQHALGVAYLGGLGVKKDVEQGLAWLEKSAAQKNPEALFKLASLRARGIELPRDDAKAAELARAAAEQGHVEAEYNLATLYATGRGVPKDIKEAAKWYQKAAEAGHPIAQSNLGVLYATGDGVEKSQSEALKWWQKAAEQGQRSAQFNLAHALREGKIIPQDLVEAYKWYNLAAEQGDEDAAIARDAMAVDLTPADMATALRRAREFKTSLYAKAQERRPVF